MFSVTSHKLYFRSGNHVIDVPTHKEKQYGDIAFRTSSNEIVYVSTGPAIPDGFNAMSSYSAPTNLTCRFPNGSIRYVLDRSRPDAFQFKFSVILSNWRKSGTSWRPGSIRGSGASYIGFIFAEVSGNFITSIGISFKNIPNDKRLPCKIKINANGNYADCYGIYSSWSNGNKPCKFYTKSAIRWPISIVNNRNGVTLNISSDDDFAK